MSTEQLSRHEAVEQIQRELEDTEKAAQMAACLCYIHYARRHPELNLQEAANLLEDLQRKLVEQARAQGGHHAPAQ